MFIKFDFVYSLPNVYLFVLEPLLQSEPKVTKATAVRQKVPNLARTWAKNGVRTLLTIFSALVATGGGASFDNFVSLVGTLLPGIYVQLWQP